MPPDLLVSNIFDHVKRAFTTATSEKKRLVGVSHKVPILLSEIGNVRLEAQAKPLRIILEKEFLRVGGVETLEGGRTNHHAASNMVFSQYLLTQFTAVVVAALMITNALLLLAMREMQSNGNGNKATPSTSRVCFRRRLWHRHW